MKLKEAEALMSEAPPTGYRVAFEERRENYGLKGDFFPERGEPAYPDMATAAEAARSFAMHAPLKYVNIHVIEAVSFRPVWDGPRFRYRK